jgi:hypothetical protein
MYKIENKFENALDLMAYTVKAMNECAFTVGDIDDYLLEASKEPLLHFLETSNDVIEECNNLSKQDLNILDDEFSSYHYDDTWRDYYYNDSYFNHNDDDNLSKFDDKYEAYEGFSLCNTHYWDPNEEYGEDEYLNSSQMMDAYEEGILENI